MGAAEAWPTVAWLPEGSGAGVQADPSPHGGAAAYLGSATPFGETSSCAGKTSDAIVARGARTPPEKKCGAVKGRG